MDEILLELLPHGLAWPALGTTRDVSWLIRRKSNRTVRFRRKLNYSASGIYYQGITGIVAGRCTTARIDSQSATKDIFSMPHAPDRRFQAKNSIYRPEHLTKHKRRVLGTPAALEYEYLNDQKLVGVVYSRISCNGPLNDAPQLWWLFTFRQCCCYLGQKSRHRLDPRPETILPLRYRYERRGSAWVGKLSCSRRSNALSLFN